MKYHVHNIVSLQCHYIVHDIVAELACPFDVEPNCFFRAPVHAVPPGHADVHALPDWRVRLRLPTSSFNSLRWWYWGQLSRELWCARDRIVKGSKYIEWECMAQALGHLHHAVHLPSHGGAIDFDTHHSGRRVSSEIRVRLTAAIMGEKCAHAAGEAIVNASIKVTAGTVRGARLCYIILPGGPRRVSGRLETHVHVLVTTSTRKLKSSEAVNVSGADDLIRLDLGVRGA